MITFSILNYIPPKKESRPQMVCFIDESEGIDKILYIKEEKTFQKAASVAQKFAANFSKQHPNKLFTVKTLEQFTDYCLVIKEHYSDMVRLALDKFRPITQTLLEARPTIVEMLWQQDENIQVILRFKGQTQIRDDIAFAFFTLAKEYFHTQFIRKCLVSEEEQFVALETYASWRKK